MGLVDRSGYRRAGRLSSLPQAGRGVGRPAGALLAAGVLEAGRHRPSPDRAGSPLDLEEYRLQDGWGNGGKRGSHRADRRPLAVVGEQWVRSLTDVPALLPPLPDPFTRKDLSRVLGKRGVAFNRAVRLLEQCGAVEITGKKGNAILYRLNK